MQQPITQIPDAPDTSFLDTAIPVVGSAVAVSIGLLLLVFFIRRFLYICRPSEILIFSGKKSVDGDRGYRVVDAGRAIRLPVLQQVDRMDMTTMPVVLKVNNAFSKGNIQMQIDAMANVKIASEPKYRGNAIERFLGRSQNEIRDVAQRTLEGALREVIATMTPESVNEDRLQFAERIVENAVPDMHKLGLQLDTLKIQHVSDDAKYLESLGRGRIAEVQRDAENAESMMARETQEAVSAARQRQEQSRAASQTLTEVKQNELRRVTAELEGQAQAAEREAEAAAQTARWEAEQELQTVRVELERQRLEADEVLRANANAEAAALIAKGDAAPALEQGLASAEVLRMLSEAWIEAGPNAREVFVIQQLDKIVETVVRSVQGVEVGRVAVLDNGDGRALPNYVSSYPQTVAAIMGSLKETLGVDVQSALNGSRESQVSGGGR
ncbi:MAG: flotillin family protein [Deltaproteobacteria bacterium]|nr:flotillin family protein [Deltaproteobacteria bacterium]